MSGPWYRCQFWKCPGTKLVPHTFDDCPCHSDKYKHLAREPMTALTLPFPDLNIRTEMRNP